MAQFKELFSIVIKKNGRRGKIGRNMVKAESALAPADQLSGYSPWSCCICFSFASHRSLTQT